MSRFAEAVRTEGVPDCCLGCNRRLHLHLSSIPATYTVQASLPDRKLSCGHKTGAGKSACERVYWYEGDWDSLFKRYRPELIEEYAQAFRKVAENYKELLAEDPGDPPDLGGWHFFRHSS